MSVEFIAVEGLTIEPQGIVSPGTGTLTITSIPSSKGKVNGKGMYKTPFQFTLSGANASGYDPGSVSIIGTASINATAEKVKVDGILILRVGDENAAVNMTGTQSGTPVPFTEPWKITDAGQSTLKAS
jgi:hypothetical protein